MKEAFHECPYFDGCQVNECPLSSNYQYLKENYCPADKLLWNYKKCRLRKATRMKLGQKYGLLNFGLTNKERGNHLRKYPELKVIPVSTKELLKNLQKKRYPDKTLGGKNETRR